MFSFYKKYDQFLIFNKNRKKYLRTVNMIIKWIYKLFCSKCRLWECSSLELHKETLISRRKCSFDLQLIYRRLVFSGNYPRGISKLLWLNFLQDFVPVTAFASGSTHCSNVVFAGFEQAIVCWKSIASDYRDFLWFQSNFWLCLYSFWFIYTFCNFTLSCVYACKYITIVSIHPVWKQYYCKCYNFFLD